MTWSPRTTAVGPRARLEHAAIFDEARGRMLVFGGTPGQRNVYDSETWSYGPTQPAAITLLGAGCPGSAGTPSLLQVGNSLPWVGRTCAMQVASLPNSSLSFGCLGFSQVAWAGHSLPWSLTALGMPGCFLRVSPDATFTVFSSGGTASWALTIPSVPALVGMLVYAQAAVIDPPSNAAGAVMSNAVGLRLGGI